MEHEEARHELRTPPTRWALALLVQLGLAGTACSSIVTPVTPAEKAARAVVAKALNPANRPGITAEKLVSMPNPNGHGVFVYVKDPFRVRGVKQRFIWMVLDGKAYALNGPTKEVAPPVPWSREAPQGDWIRTNLSRYSSVDAMKIVFDR